MNQRNYQKELDQLLVKIDNEPKKTLFLHCCCAPCSSYCLEYLSRYFDITVLYYNPNISPQSEFVKRAEEQRRFIGEFPLARDVKLIVDNYDPEEFYSAVQGSEDAPEGGERCFICYRLRLERAAKYAAAHGFDWFCTTLSISPLKNCEKLRRRNRMAKTRKKQFSLSLMVRIFLAVLVVVSIVVFVSSTMRYNELLKQKEELEQTKNELTDEKEELKELTEADKDEAYVVRMARKFWNLFFPDEEIFFNNRKS